jgi:COP9 signalosome complex subunit 2
MIKPYTRLNLDYLADVSPSALSDTNKQTLSLSQREVESLVVSLILDGRIKGKIDQVKGYIVLDRL